MSSSLNTNFMTNLFWGKYLATSNPPMASLGKLQRMKMATIPPQMRARQKSFARLENKLQEKIHASNILIKCHPLHKLGRSQPCKFNVNY